MGKIMKSCVLAACVVLCAAQPVEKQPVLKQPLAEVLFRAGQRTLLECVTEGKEAGIKYSWTKNGQPFNPSSDVTQRKDEGSLVFANPKPEDEGIYQCFAQSEAGTASTRPVSFKRTYLNPVNVKTEDHTPVDGRPYQLKCPIPEGYPKPTISWKKRSGAEDKSYLSRRATPSPDGTLHFSNVTDEDVGAEKYVCVATSPAFNGEVTLAEHVIKSTVPDKHPEQKGELVPQYVSNDMMAKAGDVTMIYCIYGGTPLAHPDWFKDGKDVNGKPGDRVTRHNRTSGRRLLISKTLPEDQGTYVCDVNNAVGKPQKHTMKLTVVSAPSFTKQPEKKMLAKEGQDVTIPCEASGIPAPKLSYTYNGKAVSNARVATSPAGITIKGVQKSDKGYYGCKAANEHGDEYAETLLLVA